MSSVDHDEAEIVLQRPVLGRPDAAADDDVDGQRRHDDERRRRLEDRRQQDVAVGDGHVPALHHRRTLLSALQLFKVIDFS